MSNKVDQIVDIAERWAGRDFRQGVPEQCAHFVRAVFEEAGISLPVAQNPTDHAFPIGAGFANSFAGDECGSRITSASEVKRGDIVMFANTYGSFPAGTITHVGIAVGDGKMVDRPTASAPVKKRPISTFSRFAEARRWESAVDIKVSLNGQVEPSILAFLQSGETAMVSIRGLANKLDWDIVNVTGDHVLLANAIDAPIPLINLSGIGYVPARMLPPAVRVQWVGGTRTLELTSA